MRSGTARRGSGELKVDRHADPALLRRHSGRNVRNDQGLAGSRAMQCSTLTRFTGIAHLLAGFSPLGCPGMAELKFLRHVR